MLRMQRHAMSWIILVMLVTRGPALECAAQSRSAMRGIIRELTREAKQVREQGELLADEPDFAERYDGEISAEAVQRALVSRHGRDAFADAYIRWQLTSFDVDLPLMSDREFRRMLTQMPAWFGSARADDRLIAAFEHAADLGSLNERQFQQLQQINDDLDRRTREAELLNTPPTQFREWLREQADAQGHTARAFELAVEHCHVIIQGGWPTRAIKTEITARSTAIGEDESIDRATRDQLRATLEAVRGMERRFINEVTFMRDRSVNVSFSTAAVRTRDIENWTERLYGARDEKD